MRALATTAAAAAALAILAGCSGGPPRHGDVIDRPADSVTPLTCWQQYQAWKHGPAETPLKAFDREIRAVRAAGSTDNISRLRAALVSAGKAAGRLTAYPVPQCVDPAGYYASVLAHVQAAGDTARSATGLGGLRLAEVPLKALPAIERKLNAELWRATRT